MKVRVALIGVLAAALAAVTAPLPAQAGPNDNNNATVAGVSSVAPGPGACSAGHFCLYTGAGYTGRLFKLYRCQTYALSNWNGTGSWINHNTGGAHAYLLDSNRNVLVDSNPNTNWYSYNYSFRPVWYVRAC